MYAFGVRPSVCLSVCPVKSSSFSSSCSGICIVHFGFLDVKKIRRIFNVTSVENNSVPPNGNFNVMLSRVHTELSVALGTMKRSFA